MHSYRFSTRNNSASRLKSPRLSRSTSSAAPTEATHAGSDGGATPDQANSTPKVDYSVRYKNWSTVTATARKGTEDQVTLVFKRDGLWSWKLSGIDLPIDRIAPN
ncbi:MAG: hypothetical protein V4765_31570 [Burkholderia cenocepacia]